MGGTVTNFKDPTLDMMKAAIGALIEAKVLAEHVATDRYLQVWAGVEKALRVALDVAPWCEHGVAEGEYCRPCNAEYKRAAIEQYGHTE